jgi:hypothetical protein
MEKLKVDVFDSPLYVMVFLLLLVGGQIRAFYHQFELGFRPFIHEPVRVPFSWDMFAVKSERCLLSWDPPLKATPIGVLKELKQFSAPFEWDVIYDSPESYQLAGQTGCSFDSGLRSSTIKFRIRCFNLAGIEVEHEFPCF